MTRDEALAVIAARGHLQNADLRDAYLQGAYLQGADLRGADLQGAILRGAYLQGAYLRGAILRGADLQGAILRGAYLRGADLQGAILRGADLQGAYLQGAILRGADLQGANLPEFQIPQAGTLTVYKKASGKVLTLLVSAKAKRTASLVGRKCRAAYVKVIAGASQPVKGDYSEKTVYQNGKITRADKWDDDPRVECTHGIHFFMTREEARDY